MDYKNYSDDVYNIRRALEATRLGYEREKTLHAYWSDVRAKHDQFWLTSTVLANGVGLVTMVKIYADNVSSHPDMKIFSIVSIILFALGFCVGAIAVDMTKRANEKYLLGTHYESANFLIHLAAWTTLLEFASNESPSESRQRVLNEQAVAMEPSKKAKWAVERARFWSKLASISTYLSASIFLLGTVFPMILFVK